VHKGRSLAVDDCAINATQEQMSANQINILLGQSVKSIVLMPHEQGLPICVATNNSRKGYSVLLLLTKRKVTVGHQAQSLKSVEWARFLDLSYIWKKK